jgi:hypothetical protein
LRRRAGPANLLSLLIYLSARARSQTLTLTPSRSSRTQTPSRASRQAARLSLLCCRLLFLLFLLFSRPAGLCPAGPHFTCCTSTKVQILTQQWRLPVAPRLSWTHRGYASLGLPPSLPSPASASASALTDMGLGGGGEGGSERERAAGDVAAADVEELMSSLSHAGANSPPWHDANSPPSPPPQRKPAARASSCVAACFPPLSAGSSIKKPLTPPKLALHDSTKFAHAHSPPAGAPPLSSNSNWSIHSDTSDTTETHTETDRW